jgi:colanic acid/amylovoran biosynthesis protein
MKILIVNLHSALNLGDESIMRGTLHLLQKKYKNANFTLMANHPTSWQFLPNVKIIPSLINFIESSDNIFLKAFHFLKIVLILVVGQKHIKSSKKDNELNIIIDAINKADVIYSCGGGNFYSNTFIGSNLIINLIAIIYSGLLEKNIIMLPQSFGPFNNKFHTFLVKKALQYPQKIYVRDTLSYNLLVSIGVSAKKLKLLPDLALSLPSAKNKMDKFNQNEINVGITVMNRGAQTKDFVGQADYQQAISQYISYLVNSEKYSISLFVQCYGPSIDQNDEIITSAIYEQYRTSSSKIYLKSGYKDSRALIEDISKMDILVATRMHTAIFGLLNYLPTLIIGYQPKAEGLCKLFGIQEYYVDFEKIDPYFLISKTERIIQNYHDIRIHIINKLSGINSLIEREILGDQW